MIEITTRKIEYPSPFSFMADPKNRVFIDTTGIEVNKYFASLAVLKKIKSIKFYLLCALLETEWVNTWGNMDD